MAMSKLVQDRFGNSRVLPELPLGQMRSYSIRQPIGSHKIRVGCKVFQCQEYVEGWRTIVPADSPQAQYIESLQCGRKYRKTIPGPGLVEYTFSPGQECFTSSQYGHYLALERPSIFKIRNGDWRGNPDGRDWTVSPQAWVDAFGENLQSISDFHERG